MGPFGAARIHEFTELRWITVRTTPRHNPFQGAPPSIGSLLTALLGTYGTKVQ